MEIKDTLLMPKTGFEMRGNLTQKEPKMLQKWNEEKLYEAMNANREGCEEYLLHDGPPYANGDIHCGHMLNRFLKDFTIRYKNMMGYKTPFVFGWDTHGLPIEVKLTKNGVNRKAMSVPEFRDLCRDYALKQVERQKAQFQRLGCLGDYAHPYLTLTKDFEARELEVFSQMALQGLIYKGLKPVYWSPSSESALAEAEVEYQDVLAKTMYVSFDVADGKGLLPSDAKILIWTTTPWTIPADLALTVNPQFEYGLFDTARGKLVFLISLKDKLAAELGLGECKLLTSFKGQEMEYITVHHPLYQRLSTVIVNAFVTEDSGTGVVHTAPDHGVDDFNACLKYGIKPFRPVDERGYMHFSAEDPCNGKFYEEANDIVIAELQANGHLLKEMDITHSYPHDWRTHKPIIFRATPQWFCSIAPIKEKLLAAIHGIHWEPAWGEQKMVNMIKDRTDWCISRQRAWGVPLPIIYNEDGSPIIEKAVFDHIRDIVAKEGTNAWFSKSEKELLPAGYSNPLSPHGAFKKETDIMDVWFDSGSSWNGVLRERGLQYPADLYLEGNDQYRGWFNASLILSVAFSGLAPFKNCVTHGWVMDDNWQKMSKSAGNGIDPSKVANQYGADLLRLWAATVNFESDVRISESIVQSIADSYRKIRNTFKFMLGNLQDGEKEYVQPTEEPKLWPVDRWILAEEENVKNTALADYAAFRFANVQSGLTNFLVELSSFYLDFAKDALYCEKADSPRRKAIQYVLYTLSKELCLLYNPILSFTMDEVYSFLPGHTKMSPQLEDMPKESHRYSKETSTEFALFNGLRSLVLKALEDARAKSEIGASSEAALRLGLANPQLYDLLKGMDEEETENLFMVSEIELFKAHQDTIEVKKSEERLCERCRNLRSDGREVEGHYLCERCLSALEK